MSYKGVEQKLWHFGIFKVWDREIIHGTKWLKLGSIFHGSFAMAIFLDENTHISSHSDW